MKRILTLAATLLLALPALAHEVKVGDLEIIHANIPQPAASAKAAGGFMAISNNGTAFRVFGGTNAPASTANVDSSGYQFGVRHSF